MITDSDKIVSEGKALPVWLSWIRLLIIHPVLIGWAWWHRNTGRN